MNEVIYLCDRKKECNKSITCGGEYCNHTYDPEHAKNGTTDHPESDERFQLSEYGDYWEKE